MHQTTNNLLQKTESDNTNCEVSIELLAFKGICLRNEVGWGP